MQSTSPSLWPIIKRIAAWLLVILVANFVFSISWGGFRSVSDDKTIPRHLEQERLIKHLTELKDTGVYDSDLYTAEYDLAWHYWKEHQYKDAEPYLKSSLETANVVFGEKSDQYYKTLAYLGAFYRDWAKFKEAEKYYERLLELDKERHVQLAVDRDLNNLGVLYFLWGQSFPSMNRRFETFKKSKEMYDKCLVALDSLPLGQRGDLQRVVLRNKAALLMELGETTAAQSVLNEVKH